MPCMYLIAGVQVQCHVCVNAYGTLPLVSHVEIPKVSTLTVPRVYPIIGYKKFVAITEGSVTEIAAENPYGTVQRLSSSSLPPLRDGVTADPGAEVHPVSDAATISEEPTTPTAVVVEDTPEVPDTTEIPGITEIPETTQDPVEVEDPVEEEDPGTTADEPEANQAEVVVEKTSDAAGSEADSEPVTVRLV